MNKPHIRRYLGYFIIIAVAITVISAYAGTLFRKEAYSRTVGILQRANVLTRNLMTISEPGSVDDYIRSIAVDDVRITVIQSDGTVVADSQADIATLDNHADRPEVFSALNGVEGYSKRFSDSLDTSLVYVALPLFSLADRQYVIRSSMSVDEIDQAVGTIIGRIVLTGIITFVALSVLSYFSERRIIAPLADIQKAAEAYSQGNLDYQFSISAPDDAKIVADTLNDMARTLKLRLREITKGKIELDAVFASMTEAVVVLDGHLNIRHLNRSALNIVRIDEKDILHHSLIEVFMNSELQALAEETLGSQNPIEKVIRFDGNRDLIFQVHGTRIATSEEKSARNAVVLVMNDITKTQHLENMRRDFVANVSHELKTPITNIKGYLETLSDGAADDKETAERFLAISIRNADRLNAILDDLLSLSRLEQMGRKGLDFESRSLFQIVNNAIQTCMPSATEKKIRFKLQGDKNLTVLVNTLLMEQAITNLLDNAIKYSDSGSDVAIDVQTKGTSAEISVQDRGIGIPKKDVSRIFERFYRVDKARSRELGGTGLGLAIVKHIAIVHGGIVRVKSEPGTGSVFTISLPLETL